jgi:PAS domain S-box-containing protein
MSYVRSVVNPVGDKSLVKLALPRCLIAAWLSLFLIGPTFALDPGRPFRQYPHSKWRNDAGLPQNSVLSIAQTAEGFLWLGTEEGLARFDGLSFKVFDNRNTPELHSNEISALFADHLGRLWIGTGGGGLTVLEGRQFRNYSRANGLSSDVITALDEDAAGTLYIGTDGGGLNVLKDGRFRAFKATDGLPDDAVLSITHDSSGTVWAGTHSGIGFVRDGRAGTDQRAELKGKRIRAIRFDSRGALWAGTNDDGLFCMAAAPCGHYTKRDGLPSNTIWNLAIDRNGVIWVGTGAGGLSRFLNGAFQNYSVKDGLSDNDITSLLEDRDGSMWIGTGSGGLNQLRDAAFVTLSKADGLSSDVALSVFEDSKGAMWVGTDQGLNRVKEGRVTAWTKRDGLSDNLVFSLCEDSGHAIWAGTKKGLNRIKDGKVKVFTTRDGLPNDVVPALSCGPSGNIWIGTRGGVARFVDGRFDTITSKDGLSNPFVLSIYEDERGVVWIGTEGGGLNRLEGGRITSFSRREGLPNEVVRTIAGVDGDLWLGTNGGGLVRFDGRNFTSLKEKNGLHSDSVFAILDDQLGNLWMTSNSGPFRVSKRDLVRVAGGSMSTLVSVPFDVRDGLATRECNGGFQPAAWRSRTGQLWFPTMGGVATVDPRQLYTSPAPPSAHIDSIIVDGRPLDLNRALDAPPGKGKLELHFVAVNLRSPERIRYRYMLEGFEKEWTEAGDRRTAFYTNIPPGDYTFRIMACDSLGLCSSKETTANLRLQPNFYQTPLFGLAICFLICGMALSLYWLRLRRHRALELKLRRLVEERTRELAASEQKFRQLAENIHEVFWIMHPEDGRFLYVSPACREIWGRTAEEIMADPSACLQQVHDDDREKAQKLKEEQRLGTEVRDEYRIRTAGGGVRWVWDRSYPVLDESGRVASVVGVVENTTARKQAEELLRQLNGELEIRVKERTLELLHANEALSAENAERRRVEQDLRAAVEAANVANRSKSEFLANMSHEIRTPLNGILGIAKLALSNNPPENQREDFETIRLSGEALITVINDILDFSRIDAGRLEIHPRPCSLRDCLEDSVRAVAIGAENNGLDLFLNIGPEVPETVMLDPDRVRQIILNLLGNAIKFTERGEVVLTARVEPAEKGGQLLYFEVSDTGIGIPASKLQSIFDAFTQVDASSKRQYGGTGLGLAISARLVKLMDGKIGVESELGRGSTFHFALPLSSIPAAGGLAPDGGAAPPFAGIRALIMDPNPTGASSVAGLLHGSGIEATLVRGPEEIAGPIQRGELSFDVVIAVDRLIEAARSEIVEFLNRHGKKRTPVVGIATLHSAPALSRLTGPDFASVIRPVRKRDLFSSLTTLLHSTAVPPEQKSLTSLARVTRQDAAGPSFPNPTSSTPECSTPDGSVRHVLVAEDNPINQRIARRLLEKDGYRVTVAANGREALTAMMHENFDLVLMDIQMPVMDGFECTAAIRELDSPAQAQVPIVAVTAHAINGYEERCIAGGMDAFVTKPVDAAKLRSAIELAFNRIGCSPAGRQN